MWAFVQDKKIDVRRLILNFVNNERIRSLVLNDEAREESRMNLTTVLAIIPWEEGRPKVEDVIITTSKDFSGTGIGAVLHGPAKLDDVVVALKVEGEMRFFHAKAAHMHPIGGGVYHLGLELTDVIRTNEFPELEELNL